MRPAAFLPYVAICGCATPAAVPMDAAVGDAVTTTDAELASCADVVTEWRAIVGGLSRDCVLDSDCQIIGAPWFPCDGYPSIAGGCFGEAVNAASYAANGATASALEEHFHTQACACPDGCGFDCPESVARCLGGACVAESVSPGCNPPPPPPPGTFEAELSVLEVDVEGQPQLGQGLGISIDFVKDKKPYAFEETPGSPFGCQVTEYTLAELAARLTQNEGTVSVTAADGAPAIPPCVFVASVGYRCLGPSGAGDATVATGGALPAGAAQYAIVGAAFTASDVGRYLEINGFVTNPANSGAFAIISFVSATEIVVAQPAAVASATAEAIAYATVAGAGPLPGLADPGLLGDTDLLTVTLDSTGGAGDWPSFTVMSASTGDDFALDTASRQVLVGLPTDGSAFSLDCAGAGGACNMSLGTILEITTSDGPIAGLSPHELPPPTTRQVTIRCAQIESGLIAVPAVVSAYLQGAGATRIRASYRRINVAQPFPADVPPTNVFVGHATIGFTDP